MGESSAKHLRGAAMMDVIFTGWSGFVTRFPRLKFGLSRIAKSTGLKAL